MNKLQAMKHLLEWEKLQANNKERYDVIMCNVTVRIMENVDGYEVRYYNPETMYVDVIPIYQDEIKLLKAALETRLGRLFV